MTGKSALAGLRVIECGNMVAASYAAKLMADLGAEVIKVEHPDGDRSRSRGPFPKGMEGNPEASGLFLYLNANKKSVVIDPASVGDKQALLRLLESADVLIHNFTREDARNLGIDYESIAARFPKLVYTWVTPFGLSGPHSDWVAENITVVSAGGWASITPGNSTLDQEPPLIAYGQQGEFQAATHAAIATMGALFARKRTGLGQLVEVSAQECIAAALELALVNYTYSDRIPSRLGIRTSAPMEIMECSDGLIFVMTADPHQWDAFVRMMDNPDWASWEVFDDRFKRGENRDALRPLIEDWLMQHTVQEVFDMAGTARLPFAPVSTIADLIDSPHLKARGFFVEVRLPATAPSAKQSRPAISVAMPGAPYLLPDTPWEIRSAPPTLGQHSAEILDPLRPVTA